MINLFIPESQNMSANLFNEKYFFATDYRAIVGTAVSTRFRLLSWSRRPDNQRSGISGRPTGPRERARSRREEERKNNWKFSDGQAEGGGGEGWDSGTPAAEDVLAGRLAIKQRARAKYLHKSVLPCAARRGAYTTPTVDTHVGWTRTQTRLRDVTRIEIRFPEKKMPMPSVRFTIRKWSALPNITCF